MTKLQTTGIFFLVCLMTFCGCSNSKIGWDNLYHSETDAETDVMDDGLTEHGSEGETTASASRETDIQDKTDTQETEVTVCVYVCGAVVSPGVYELPAGARVHQAIQAAGGLTEDADLFLVNQAKLVEDGEQIRIYTKEEAKEAEQRISTGLSNETDELDDASVRVNINHATADALMTLPGIGEAKALSIIEYRQTNGSFQKIEDIMNIPGIKEAVFSKIKDKITV